MNLFKRLTILCVFILLNGCATVHDMGIHKGDNELDLNGNGMLLMTLEFSNIYKPNKEADKSQKISLLSIESQDQETGKIQRHTFIPDEDGIFKLKNHTMYAFRMALPEGEYRIKAAIVSENYFPFGDALAMLPIMLDAKVRSGEIIYIGNVAATIHERREGEAKASPFSLPLFPSVAYVRSGFYYGTFKVLVSDKYDSEAEWYKNTYPALYSLQIHKDILQPYDYQKAKKWAEGSGMLITYPSYESKSES